MSSPDVNNRQFEMAAKFVNQTNRHIFLTGKAGTGKTTFLKYIRERSSKKMAVVAPTGVAAINAGGVTMHSFFQLPFGAFIPDLLSGWNSSQLVNNPNTLFKNLRLSRDKKQLLQEIELLVIDEVSMLRADILDEIDIILKHFRRRPLEPFGGVQMLYIGDLFQLPPVINNEEWEQLKQYYKSPFFFDAQVLQQHPPLFIELKKIYRQHETEFINLLNNIRNNEATEYDLERLHRHYQPNYESAGDGNFITLTTHNAKADAINQNKLNRLPGMLHEFAAEIKGEFNERSVPADMVLQLKVGAQIMFIKNDKGEDRRYYNGKIATINRVAPNSIFVNFTGENAEMELEKETWKNIRYHYNKEKDRIEEEELGSFTQYPIRLAWAITIHKSQGLTFEKAIIDAGASFAPGQVYVALSRLTSLDGLVLHSRIQQNSIQTDQRVIDFSRSELGEDAMQENFQEDQQIFITQSLLSYFDWTKICEQLKENYDDYDERQIPEKNKAITWAKQLLDTCLRQQDMTLKFIKQLDQLLATAEADGYNQLHLRITAASEYFNKVIDECINSIKLHIKEYTLKSRARKYLSSCKELLILFQRKQQHLSEAVQIASGLLKGMNATELLELVEQDRKSALPKAEEPIIKTSLKPPKGETRRISLQQFKEGKQPAEIAKERGLALSTVEAHLVSFVSTGEVEVKELVPEKRMEAILKVIEEMPPDNKFSTPIKEKLGVDYSYNEIRAVLSHLERMQQTS